MPDEILIYMFKKLNLLLKLKFNKYFKFLFIYFNKIS